MSVINGVTVLESPGWRPQKTIVRAAEMVNGNGQSIGDFVRMKYVLSYSWPSLSTTLTDALIAATDPDDYTDFSVTHDTIDGNYTGTYRVTEPVQAENLTRDSSGDIVWGNVTLTLEEV